MRFRTYRDETHACHLDLVGGTAKTWSLDLISCGAGLILAVSFVCALVAQFV
jgi:hypothetical protein